MLDSTHLLEALTDKGDEFIHYQKRKEEEQELLKQQFHKFSGTPPERIYHILSKETWPGARPTYEWEEAGSLVLPFDQEFSHHQEAREWSRGILENQAVFAADGSQLLPTKDLSLPVALVQVGSFYNPHSLEKDFAKELKTKVLGPEELLASGSEEKIFHEQYISLKRYQMESQCIQEFCLNKERASRDSLAFFDGSLLISFAEILMDLHRNEYLNSVMDLLDASIRMEVPLVGYVDTSAARDLIRMFSLFSFDSSLAHHDGIRDTDITNVILPNWGDRTIAFHLLRPGILGQYNNIGGGLGFFYMRTSMSRPPARIEFPMWILEAGLLDKVVDIIRAELVIGNGYPYAIETADQIAWFSPQDRAKFGRVLHHFLEQREISLHNSTKRQSKDRRR